VKAENADSVLLAAMTFKFAKSIKVNRNIADKIGVDLKNIYEKNYLNELVLIGDDEKKTTPIIITKKKIASGNYIQLSDLNFLNPSDLNTKNAWYALIKKCLVK
ncbi:MAG: hypothetical protein IAF38_16055, partial [Bacteroidia bacterium]|nr:hypothetical protein [Bacteroidia bacterium]